LTPDAPERPRTSSTRCAPWPGGCCTRWGERPPPTLVARTPYLSPSLIAAPAAVAAADCCCCPWRRRCPCPCHPWWCEADRST